MFILDVTIYINWNVFIVKEPFWCKKTFDSIPKHSTTYNSVCSRCFKVLLFTFSIKRRTLRYKTISGNWKSFKNDEKRVLFHLKRSFRPWDIYVFSDFLIMQNNGFIRKLRWISKFIVTNWIKNNDCQIFRK